MNTWQQLYTPLGGLGLSALVALIPIIFFFLALAVFRMKGHVAGSIAGVAVMFVSQEAHFFTMVARSERRNKSTTSVTRMTLRISVNCTS